MTGLAGVPRGRPRRIVYLGTPDAAVPPLRALVDAGFDIPLVVTRDDKRRGRGSGVTPSPVKAAALELGLPVSHDVDDVLRVDADLGVVVAFGRIIRRPILERLPLVNLHFSLLPRWRGAAPVERAILAGDAVTGVCLMQIEEGLDSGGVFDRIEIPIPEHITADGLRAEMVRLGAQMLVANLTKGLSDPIAQIGEPSHAAKITSDDLHIDWSSSAAHIERQIRIGGAWTVFRGRRLKILSASSDEVASRGPSQGHGAIEGEFVGTGDRRLHVLEVQPEGKARMAWSAFVNGARPTVSETLGEGGAS